jgi:hypothetical protein
MAAHKFVSGFTDTKVSGSRHWLAVTEITRSVTLTAVKRGKNQTRRQSSAGAKEMVNKGRYTLAWLSPEAGPTGFSICCCIKYIVSII